MMMCAAALSLRLCVSIRGATKSQSQSVKIKTNSTEAAGWQIAATANEKKGQKNRCESVCCLKKFSTHSPAPTPTDPRPQIGAW